MLKSSSLYITLVISLIIAIILGSLIYISFFFRLQDSRFMRLSMLQQQLKSGIIIGTSTNFPYTQDSILKNIFHSGDSIFISKVMWGLYDVLKVKAAIQHDSLQKVMMLGTTTQDSMILYIADEDRPLSVSGHTIIQGTAYLPKAGISPAYVDGEYYKGYKNIVEGKIKTSEKDILPINKDRLNFFREYLNQNLSNIAELSLAMHDYSFLKNTVKAKLPKSKQILTDSLTGNIILFSDTTITLAASAYIENAIIVAPAIRIESGFIGTGQFIAKDSIMIGDDVQLKYPSTVAVYSRKDQLSKITVGKNFNIWGDILLYEESRSSIPSMISFGQNVRIIGNIVCHGIIDYNKNFTVQGLTSCYRFLYKSTSSRYENFLIGTTMSYVKRSKYHLESYIKNIKDQQYAIKNLKWLN